MSNKKPARSRRIKNRLAAPPDVERPLLEVFGLANHYLPDKLAPPVDREKLTRYLREELSPDELKEVCRLIASFRCWHKECAALLRNGSNV
jgi:hypothetical protein